MDFGVLVRILLVVSAAALFIMAAIFIDVNIEHLTPYAERISSNASHYMPALHNYYSGLFRSLITTLSALFLVGNFKRILIFIRRTLTTTDHLIFGKWFVYRYTKTIGKRELISGPWKVKRSLSSHYVVDMRVTHPEKGNTYRGTVIYNQRDRFNILLEGTNHQEQSLICFLPRIHLARSLDTRMIGIAVGDDADYVLTWRVYLACRSELKEEYVKKILDSGMKKLVENCKDSMIQLTRSLSSEILSSIPLTQSDFKQIPKPFLKRIIQKLKQNFFELSNFWFGRRRSSV